MHTQKHAVELENVTVTFLETKGFLGVMLLIPLVAWIVARFSKLKGLLEKNTVLDSVSFQIQQGTIHGLFGMNGAGKTSVLRAICGLEPPESGRVSIHGLETRQHKVRIHTAISMAGRKLNPSMTAIQNVVIVARLNGLCPVAAEDRARKLLDLLHVKASDVDKLPGDLSLGTYAKVCCVAALVPLLRQQDSNSLSPVLLLDEPTLGFDAAATEQFFTALKCLHRALPDLTIVLATNDPREMAICDTFTSIVEKHIVHDEAPFRELKDAAGAYRRCIRAAAALIGAPIPENGSATETLALEPIPLGGKPRAALFWRHWTDLWRSKVDTGVLILSLVVPNLTAVFASSNDPFQGFVMGIIGVFATLMVRESHRLLNRERGYYYMLETILTSPITRLEHFLMTTGCSLVTQTGFTVAFTTIVALLLRWKYGAEFLQGELNGEMIAGLGCVFVGVVIFTIAVGLLTGIIPFLARMEIASAFLVQTIPMLVVLCAGIYYQPERLPPMLAEAAQWNPLTYAADAICRFVHLDRTTSLPMTRAAHHLLPGLSDGWANVVALFALTLPAFSIAALIFWKIEPLLRRAGRLRNAS